MLDLPVTLDRSNGQPLYLQLKEQLDSLLSSDQVAPGERLPPIRRLAEQLDLAPMTVAQAYALLESEGLIHSRPGAGTYVSWREPSAEQRRSQAASHRLRQLLRPAIEAALQEGFAAAEIREEVRLSIQALAAVAPPRAVFVAMTQALAEKYAGWVERECRDFGLQVSPVSLDRVLTAPPGPESVGGADLVVTLIYYVSELRAHVGPAVEVFPLLNMVTRESQEALAAVSDDMVIGLVGESRVPRSLPAAVALFRPPDRGTITAYDGDPVALGEVARRADVVVHLDTVPAAYLDMVPADIPRIPVVYRPREDSLRDLRTLVQIIAEKKRNREARPLTPPLLHRQVVSVGGA